MIERGRLRRIFLSAFASEGLDYEGDGCQVVHADLTWSLSLVVDGPGPQAPYRLVLGASLTQLSDEAPRKAEDCYLVWFLCYGGVDSAVEIPRMPDAAFPEWSGTEDARAAAIAGCVIAAVRYVRAVDSMEALRTCYALGHYEHALIVAVMRRFLHPS